MRISIKCKIGFISNRGNMVLFILLLLSLSLRLYAHCGSEHSDITGKAIRNYKTWVSEDPDNRVGSDALTTYWIDVVNGSVDEDYPTYEAPWLEHYMDPDTGQGLWGNRSAFLRASDHWSNALDEYEDGHYSTAYHWLGRVIHLVEDMAVPAHVLLDPHWHIIWPITDPDWYEATYIEDHRLDETDISEIDDAFILWTVMYNLAEKADNFDSNDEDGEDPGSGVDRSDGFTDSEGAIIANACYREAIKSASSVLRMFYEIILPDVQFLDPSDGDIHSGIIGVPLEAQAKAYNKEYSDSWCIKKIDFYFTTTDIPDADDWTLIGSSVEPDDDDKFRYTWNNSIDDDLIWIRAISFDDGNCESKYSYKKWIRIDSTRPTLEW